MYPKPTVAKGGYGDLEIPPIGDSVSLGHMNDRCAGDPSIDALIDTADKEHDSVRACGCCQRYLAGFAV
ncbi:hypothetical protein KO481_42530 [Nocardia sp. NEAU-G5]|uniref:Uncharacterized protein n=1 Tax=Nocardia albiluteola TaxID=2842303 RepID=A0ABS6BD07_9NOCA|nr:hypothetical protein [Nocardia albiluteola]MBU3068180.1 hypothetical protein [Nocardia albiluteola]